MFSKFVSLQIHNVILADLAWFLMPKAFRIFDYVPAERY